MNNLVRIAGVAGLGVAATALFAVPASAAVASGSSAAASRPAHHAGGAPVFVQNDNPSGNAVIAYDRAADGTLHQVASYPTGGDGGVLAGSVVDHLASQGSLTYDRNAGLLYSVNAGSNTVTVFAVEGDHLIRLQVLGSGGTFPVSVAVHGNLVYVLNARNGGSLQGFARLGKVLVPIAAWHRSLGLDPSETPEFTSTPGQVAFSPNGSQLLVTTKGNGSSIDVFAVGLGGLSATPVVNAEPGAVPFALTFDPDGHVIVSEAGPSVVATFTLARNGKLSPLDQQATGQAATCWIVDSGKQVYASNAGSASVSRLRVDSKGRLTSLGTVTTQGGTVDAAISADGNYLYVQGGATGTVSEFRVNGNGSLTSIGSVNVPDAVGGEGIVAL